MRRSLVALVLVAGLTLGLTPAAGAAPDTVAHPVSSSTTSAICQYLRPAGYQLGAWRTIHYGTAHVTQCMNYQVLANGNWRIACGQYVWNVPSPYFDWYAASQPDNPWCW